MAAAARRQVSLARAVVRAYNRLFAVIDPLLSSHGYNADVLDDRIPAWREAVDDEVLPEISDTYIAALLEDARKGVTVDAQPYAVRYLSTVDNRMVGLADYAFDLIRVQLREGSIAGETIPELAARVDTLLTDEQRWRNRGTVVARTEVIGANNAGAYDAARVSAAELGVEPDQVVKEWLATVSQPTRTRPTHMAADGQQVKGLESRFIVGDSHMLRPHDPAGAADEVIQCRCSVLYHFPGDLDYPDTLAAGGSMNPNNHDQSQQLFDVSQMPPKLQAYWITGEGGLKIAWGAPGDFTRCQVALKGKVPGRMIDGTCANLHKKATGTWPGQKAAAGVSTWADALAVVNAAPALAAADASGPMVDPPADAELPAGVDPVPVEEDDGDTSVVIVALPAADDPVHGIGPEEKHATILFFGELDTLDDSDAGLLAQVCTAVAGATAPFTETVTGVEQLGSEGAEVWMLAGDELPALRSDLIDTDSETVRMLENADQFPDYTPHTTIGYPADQGDDVEDTAWPALIVAAGEVKTITYDRLALWWGTERSEYPLTGGDVTPSSDNQQEDTVTAAATEAATPVKTEGQTDVALTWSGVLAPEGLVTGDKRKFADGAIIWMTTPGVLKAMFADKPGHDDSVPVGLITAIERVDGKLPFSGTWATGDEAEKARQWNIDGRLRGVSVDLDDVEMHLEDDDGNVLEGDAIWDVETEPVLVVDKGRVRAATLWCTPAFVEAYVLDSTVASEIPDSSIVDASGVTPLGVAAAALYASAQAPPKATSAPSSVFANPGLEVPTPLTVTEDGRVFGHIATWGTCHIGIEGACVTPPTSDTDYAYFCTGMYTTSDDVVIPVGQVTMGTGHAELALGWRPTVDHYDDTGTAAAYINVGEDSVGIWMAGVLAEHLPEAQRLALQRTGSISGDWRAIGGNLELVAALGVNVPGFPIPRVQSRVASLAAAGGRVQPTALVASGIVSHVEAQLAPAVDYKLLAREVTAYQTRQTRLAASRRALRKSRQAALAGRLKRG